MLGLRFCARAFSSCGKRGPLFIAVRGPLTIVASLLAEHRLQTRRLSSCGSRTRSLRGMWDLPRPGLEPVSPALAGRFSSTAPPGKPHSLLCLHLVVKDKHQGLPFKLLQQGRLRAIGGPDHCPGPPPTPNPGRSLRVDSGDRRCGEHSPEGPWTPGETRPPSPDASRSRWSQGLLSLVAIWQWALSLAKGFGYFKRSQKSEFLCRIPRSKILAPELKRLFEPKAAWLWP